jgi:hypothetical protein
MLVVGMTHIDAGRLVPSTTELLLPPPAIPLLRLVTADILGKCKNDASVEGRSLEGVIGEPKLKNEADFLLEDVKNEEEEDDEDEVQVVATEDKDENDHLLDLAHGF